MNFDVLPGPPLAELARTTVARATAAIVTCTGSRQIPLATVPVRADRAGLLVLMPPAESLLARHLDGSGPAAVTVALPAEDPFSALRLSGLAARSPAGYLVRPRSAEFSGPPARVALSDYAAAAPDPLWREAPAILDHLEHHHMAALVSCIRAHGLVRAEVVLPRSLDRFGLRFLVLMPSGVAAVRLAFPGGPVTGLHDVPASIQAMLTCRCAAG